MTLEIDSKEHHPEGAFFQEPRTKPASEIKLLRVEITPKANAPFELLGHDWSPAQPSDSLTPMDASVALGVPLWDLESRFQKRYHVLQKRFPPQVFDEMHWKLRPSAELLSDVNLRLNWFWSSGLIPPAFPVEGFNPMQKSQQAKLNESCELEILDHLKGLLLI
jgi:hypothetical protein